MRLTADDLVERTLRRQFPGVRGTGPSSVVDLFGRIGPVQSQQPRAPFVAAASRLPGVTHATISAAFAGHALVKGSSLRGTVHTTTARQQPVVSEVAVAARRSALRSWLGLRRLSAEEVEVEIERFAATRWVPRDELTDHVLEWVRAAEGGDATFDPRRGAVRNTVWGHARLVRGPADGQRWDRRTDTLHRSADALLGPRDDRPVPSAAMEELVRCHLAAFGPASRRDLAFFGGMGLTQVDAAVTALGEAIVRLTGPEGDLFDLASPPRGGTVPEDVRLLPEFDALLLAYHGQGRTRFLDAEHLSRVWRKANGLFSPVVLAQGRLVATWRVTGPAGRSVIEVERFAGTRGLDAGDFSSSAAAVGAALALEIADVRVT